jgi:hypothetical protein
MKEIIACSMLPIGSKWRLVAHLEEITPDEHPQLSGDGGYLISSFLSAIHNAAKQIASAAPQDADEKRNDDCNLASPHEWRGENDGQSETTQPDHRDPTHQDGRHLRGC